MTDLKLDLTSLQAAYRSGQTSLEVIGRVYDRITQSDLNPVWISLKTREELLQRTMELDRADRESLPLYGVPFAVKDNIDVAGMVTTAGCPAYGYRAEKTATVVSRLEDAGAVLIGKTNLDQFATGLVGARSPYGACACVFDQDYISGGSSSGSAIAVASGLVTFSVGTDTAGSGRVPAAFNNIVGLKPTRGSVSASGVVPACRSLDCVSLFALTCDDARQVLKVARGFDAADPYSRAEASQDAPAPWLVGPFRVGIPQQHQWEFFGDGEAMQLYSDSIRALEAIGGSIIEFDFQPFREAAELLYSGPWVSERLAALQSFFESHAEDVHPVVREIIAGGKQHSAADAFLGQYRLQELKKRTAAVWQTVDVLLLPTTGTIYTREAVEAEPITLNTNLGHYTNFVNLLDLAAVALPAGFRINGLPFGVSLIGPKQTEAALLSVADRLHRRFGKTLGGTATDLYQTNPIKDAPAPPGCVLVAVVGAHLTGQPLNHQLTARGGRLARATKTSASYRLYALPGTTPSKPGLIRSPGFDGPGIELEVWAMPMETFGGFVAEIPEPLGIGNVELADRSFVKGFICEPYAVEGAIEITHYGGWRAYMIAN